MDLSVTDMMMLDDWEEEDRYEKLLEAFKTAISHGCSFADVKKNIYDFYGYSIDDLSPQYQQRILSILSDYQRSFSYASQKYY